MRLTAKEAKRITNKPPSPDDDALAYICRAIRDAAMAGGSSVIVGDSLTDKDQVWLVNNGYEVWQQSAYRTSDYDYLICWERASE